MESLWIERRILRVRGQRILLDVDLAELYGVPTKRLNEQVKRNRERFPPEFMFPLSDEEKREVVAKCDHLKALKFSHAAPNAFTEHGVLMLANVLNSGRAIETSIQIVKAFARLRAMLAENASLSRRLDDLERRYDARFKVVFDAVRSLVEPVGARRRRIGFRP